jgi:hypothetical protein
MPLMGSAGRSFHHSSCPALAQLFSDGPAHPSRAMGPACGQRQVVEAGGCVGQTASSTPACGAVHGGALLLAAFDPEHRPLDTQDSEPQVDMRGRQRGFSTRKSRPSTRSTLFPSQSSAWPCSRRSCLALISPAARMKADWPRTGLSPPSQRLPSFEAVRRASLSTLKSNQTAPRGPVLRPLWLLRRPAGRSCWAALHCDCLSSARSLLPYPPVCC